MNDRLMIVGPGKLGLALGYALWQADGVDGLEYHGRRPEPPSHPLFTQGVARYVYGLERPSSGTTGVFSPSRTMSSRSWPGSSRPRVRPPKAVPPFICPAP